LPKARCVAQKNVQREKEHAQRHDKSSYQSARPTFRGRVIHRSRKHVTAGAA
jgi:hypothetical protein